MQVTGTALAMIRGDSETIAVTCYDERNEIATLVQGDKVYFTIKKSTKVVEKILQKTVTEFDDGIAYINILPGDTKSLECDTYVYDVQINKADGTVSTVIPPSKFVIREEVTYE